MAYTIYLNGIDEFGDVLYDTVQNVSEKALTQICLEVEKTAKELAPVDTGELRRSITSEVNGNEGTVGTNLEYAPYVEYGTGLFAENGDGRQDVPWSYQDAKGDWHSTLGQKPQPFLRPALDANRDKIAEIVKATIIEGLTK